MNDEITNLQKEKNNNFNKCLKRRFKKLFT